jgi:hypothetical protein
VCRFGYYLVRAFHSNRVKLGTEPITELTEFTFDKMDTVFGMGQATFTAVGTTYRVTVIEGWFDEVFTERLTLSEKEKIRMRSEPWVAKRDANLRDMFKP